jgi:hypothetical protein
MVEGLPKKSDIYSNGLEIPAFMEPKASFSCPECLPLDLIKLNISEFNAN